MKRSEKPIAGIACAAIIVLALAVRLIGLGRVSLDFDEYLHVFAAKSLIATGHPALPSGNDYPRALPYTHLVALSMRLFGDSETAARLPSVVFGVLLVLLAGAMTRRWWGNGPAVLAMALLAIEPYGLQLSGVCRMYTAFHFFYMAALWAWFEAIESAGPRLKRFGLFILAAVLTFMSVILHDLAVELVVTVFGYLSIQAVLTRKPKYWVPVFSAAVAGLAELGLGVVPVLAKIWQHINWAPAYAASTRYDTLFYWRAFKSVDPWLVFLVVPALVWCIVRNRAQGWFLASAIVIPAALHSLIMDWKQVRYLLHIVPLMVLVVGAAVWWLAEQLSQIRANKAQAAQAQLAIWAGPSS